MNNIASLLDSGGVFSEKLPSFEIRPGQQAMLQDVHQAYENNAIALIEAGTGTGKSLAYLIPALLWARDQGEPTIVATHTIALQEQLIQKDIPFILNTLDLNLKVVLVKGMQNYICLRKLHDAAAEVPESLFRWVKTAQEGSKSELPLLPSNDLWEQIGAEGEACTHVKCPHYKECFVFKARREAADAHLIVANHHLLFADLSLRHASENYKEICVLPPYQRLVLDEAHHVEDVATEYFADKVSRRGLIHLLGRLLSDRSAGKIMALHKRLFEIYPQGGARELLDLLEITLPSQKRSLADLIHTTFETLAQFVRDHHKEERLRILPHHLAHPYWIQRLQPEVHSLIEAGRAFLQAVHLLDIYIKRDSLLQPKCEGLIADINGIALRLEGAFEILSTFIFSPLDPKRVRWIEGEGYLHMADLEIAPLLAASLFDRLPTAILCSATLATNGSFGFIRARLGIKEAVEKIYESPFDYHQQAFLSVPIDLPDPASPHFIKAAAESIFEAIERARGGTFVLFTSYQMLLQCKNLLEDPLQKNHYALFCQGAQGRSLLLDHFRSTERAVLFGTDSFWEGVDVVGEALRCVILVKLPFKVPSDPLFQARCEAIEAQGGSSFFDYSLPQAIVKFKQGFGRLIRNKDDRGCVICLDPRLVKKGYGKHFLKSLPDCPHYFEPRAALSQKWEKFYPMRG